MSDIVEIWRRWGSRVDGVVAPVEHCGWSNSVIQAQRERDIVAKAAVYRDRFAITGTGLGDRPTATHQRRMWQTLRVEIATLVPERQHDDRHRQVDRDAGLER